MRPVPLMMWEMPKCFRTNQLGWGELFPSITYSWYIEGADKRILIDTSARAELFRSLPKRNLGTPEEKLKHFGVKTF